MRAYKSYEEANLPQWGTIPRHTSALNSSSERITLGNFFGMLAAMGRLMEPKERLLPWVRRGRLYTARDVDTMAVVIPFGDTYKWAVQAGNLHRQGRAENLHSALCHCEGNFVGHRLGRFLT